MKKLSLRQFFFSTDNYERPFFLFLTLILVGMYIATIVNWPDLRQFERLVPYTVLMNIHIVLYWLAPSLVQNSRRAAIYMIVQGLLALVIVWLSESMAMIFGLYPGLIGLVIGLYRSSRKTVYWVGIYLALSLINYALMFGVEAWPWWALGIIPTVIFVAIYVIMYTRQSDARERAQALLAELEAANRQLTQYAAEVEDLTIANERQRMARELHDTLSQGLAGLILQLEAADAHLAGSRPEKARQIVQQTMDQARKTLADARRAIDDLRQGDSPNLEESIRREAQHFSEATGVACDLEIALPPGLPANLSEPVARIVSEGLTNIARHARARRAWLKLTADEAALHLEIGDDGVGFDPAAVSSGHYGLLGMRERARLAGGMLNIESKVGGGTRLRVELPVTNE